MMPVKPRIRVQQNRLREGTMPAPSGGLNTIDSGVGVPPTDSLLQYNMINAEYGLRVRLGYRDWCMNLDGPPRSILPFKGSHRDGSLDKAFATTSTGIYDVTAASTAPPKVLTFPTTTGDAGFGISTVHVTAAGHFLIYCDEVNGYYLYTETSNTWVKIAASGAAAWAINTVYALNAVTQNGGNTYTCITAGTSAGAVGPSGTGTDIVDNTVHWRYTPVVSGVDPGLFVSCISWKNRLWFTERDTTRAWYLPLLTYAGTANAFTFGTRFKAGGPLVGLWSWTFDGGSGIDDALVAVSSGGDVVIYKGTDPAQAAGFYLVGVWYVGQVPSGRRICTDNGGDLLIASSFGIMPLSKLASGADILDRSQYATHKIANAFNQLVLTYGSLPGWFMKPHPQDGTLIVNVPTASGQPAGQLATSLTTKTWAQYRGLPIYLCAEPFNGSFYFGTVDNKICINDGYLDAVPFPAAAWQATTVYALNAMVTNDNGRIYICTVAGTSAGSVGPTGIGTGIVDGTVTWNYYPDTSSPIEFSMLTSFTDFGSPRQKIMQFAIPQFMSQSGDTAHKVEIKYDWDLTEASVLGGVGPQKGSTWGSAIWDVSKWGGAYSSNKKVGGGFGIGTTVAIAVRGVATSRTVLTGFSYAYEEGGLL